MRKSRPISAGLPNERVISAPSDRPPSALLTSATITSIMKRGADDERTELKPARPARPRRIGPAAEVRDHEEEHHHHRPGVHEYLRCRDELGRREQEEDGQRGEVPDQGEGRVERVRERYDRDAGGDAGECSDDPDHPDEEVAHQDDVLYAGMGVSKRSGSWTGTRLIGSVSNMSFV